MREDAFRAFLAPKLGADSVRSYLSYGRRLERDLGLDLDAATLDERGLAGMADGLVRQGVSPASIGNCLSVARSYAAFRTGADHRARPEPATRHSFEERARPSHLTLANDHALMRLYGQIIDELRARGVVRTGNAPLGDYAETLFADAFGWTLTQNSATGHDAVRNGVRYQIKARRVGPRNPSRQLSALRRLEDAHFDILAACLFDDDFGIMRAVLIPHATVVALARRTDHTNSWRLMLSDPVCDRDDVTDVTEALRSALVQAS